MGFPDLLEGKLGGQVPGHFLPFSLAPGVGSVGEGAAQATPGSELRSLWPQFARADAVSPKNSS